jgi:hypothetical protein
MSTDWTSWVRDNADKFRMGTTAHHKLGDISRTEPDVFIVREEWPEDYMGEWLTGFGFINVRFPKATSRPLTVVELDWLATHPVILA